VQGLDKKKHTWLIRWNCEVH